jgi:hypothetical protein
MKGGVASISILVATGVLLTASAGAQSASSIKPRRVGVGVAISDASEVLLVGARDAVGAGLFPAIFLPINITSRFRVEPELSGLRESSTHSDGLEDSTRRRSLVQVGAGTFGLARRERLTLYYGGRLAYLRLTLSSFREPSPAEENTYQTGGWLFAPVIGAEYHVTEYLSVGGETSLKFISWSDDAASTNRSGTSVSSHGALTLRFYF